MSRKPKLNKQSSFYKWLLKARNASGNTYSKRSIEEYSIMESWITKFDSTTPSTVILNTYHKLMLEHNYPLVLSFYRCYVRYVFKDNKKPVKSIMKLISETYETPPSSKRDVGKKTLQPSELNSMINFLDNINKYIPIDDEENTRINLLKTRQEVIRLLLAICYDTGARIHEFQNILLRHVDLKEGVIRIFRKRSKTRNKPISKQTNILLTNYLDKHHFNPNDRIFPQSYTQIYTVLRTLGEVSIGKSVTPHWLRFSVLQHLADDGATEAQIMSFGDIDSPDVVSCYVKNSRAQQTRALLHHPSFYKRVDGKVVKI